MYPPQQPYALQQQPPQQGYSPTNGMASIVKALMDGNSAYRQQQGGQPSPGPSLVPGSAVPGAMGPTSMGGRAGPAPLTDPGAMMPGLGAGPPPQASMPPTGGPPGAGGPVPMPMPRPEFGAGAPPMDPTALAGSGLPQTPGMPPSSMLATAGAPGVDPMTQALMSPIPGQ